MTKKHKLSVFILLPVLSLAVYTALIVRSGQKTTDQLLLSAQALADTGLSVEDLPVQWLDEMLQVEDPGFYQHNGIDLSSPGAGLTSLTQALVKIHYFDDFKPGFAKYKQTILALVLDSRMSKQDQLNLVLNSARLGHINGIGISGFDEAAEVYFDKTFSDITHEEFLALVAMLVGPNHFSVLRNPDRNKQRLERINRLLAGACRPAGLRDVYYSECQ